MNIEYLKNPKLLQSKDKFMKICELKGPTCDIRITQEITLAREHFLCKFPVLYISQNPQTIFIGSALTKSSLGTYLNLKKKII